MFQVIPTMMRESQLIRKRHTVLLYHGILLPDLLRRILQKKLLCTEMWWNRLYLTKKANIWTNGMIFPRYQLEMRRISSLLSVKLDFVTLLVSVVDNNWLYLAWRYFTLFSSVPNICTAFSLFIDGSSGIVYSLQTNQQEFYFLSLMKVWLAND